MLTNGEFNVNSRYAWQDLWSGPYMQTSTAALGETAAMEAIFQHRQLQQSFPSLIEVTLKYIY